VALNSLKNIQPSIQLKHSNKLNNTEEEWIKSGRVGVKEDDGTFYKSILTKDTNVVLLMLNVQQLIVLKINFQTFFIRKILSHTK